MMYNYIHAHYLIIVYFYKKIRKQKNGVRHATYNMPVSKKKLSTIPCEHFTIYRGKKKKKGKLSTTA